MVKLHTSQGANAGNFFVIDEEIFLIALTAWYSTTAFEDLKVGLVRNPYDNLLYF